MLPLLEQSLVSQEAFIQNAKTLRSAVNAENSEFIQDALKIIKKNLTTPDVSPITQLLSVKLMKDFIETFNDEVIALTIKIILPVYESIALFDQYNDDPDRGEKYFGNNPETQIIGNSFFRLVLESIWVWSKWFPFDPEQKQISEYKITFERLILQSVTFTSTKYFAFNTIFSNLPDSSLPRVLIRQTRAKTTVDLIHQGKLKATSEEVHILKHKLRKNKLDDLSETFTDCFRRVWRRYKKVFKKVKKLNLNSGAAIEFQHIIDQYKKDMIELQKNFFFEEIQHSQSGQFISNAYEQNDYIRHLQYEVKELKAQLNKTQIQVYQSHIPAQLKELIDKQSDVSVVNAAQMTKEQLIQKINEYYQMLVQEKMKNAILEDENHYLLNQLQNMKSQINSGVQNKSIVQFNHSVVSTKNHNHQHEENGNKTQDLSSLHIENKKFELNLSSTRMPIYCSTIAFKKSCLKSKSVLYYDSQVEIGIKSFIVGSDQARIQIYITNKSNSIIQNTSIKFHDSSSLPCVRHPNDITDSLGNGQQISIELIAHHTKIPYDLPTFDLTVNQNVISLPVPAMICKFLTTIQLEEGEFLLQYENAVDLLSSNIYKYNQNLFKSKSYFQQFFQESQGTNHNYYQKYFYQDFGLYLKVFVDENKQMLLTLRSSKNANEVLQFVLSSLVFLTQQ